MFYSPKKDNNCTCIYKKNQYLQKYYPYFFCPCRPLKSFMNSTGTCKMQTEQID